MTHEGLQQENEDLRRKLAEAEDALAAIREGRVDAIVVEGAAGPQVFSLTGAETIYRLAIEAMAEAMINVAPDGTILFCNARFSDFVATPQERLIGHDVSAYVAEEERDHFRALLQQGLQHPVKGRFALCGPGKARTPVRLSAKALPLADGISLCLLAMDLTELESSAQQIEELRLTHAELKEARRSALNIMEDMQATEKALRESEERIQQALRIGRSFTFEWQPAADRVQRSTSCADILLLSGDEAVHDTGVNFFERIHPEDRQRFRQVLQSLSPSEPTYQTEYRVLRGDGSTVMLEEIGRATFDESGRLARLTGVTTDITERKAAENAVRKHVEELHAANKELSRFNRAAVDRELRMMELKKEVNELLIRAGQRSRYLLDFEKDQS